MITEAMRKFKMSNTQTMENIKVLIGQTVKPLYWQMSEYTDSDGEVHHVLAIDFAERGCFRTEVAAFIERFNSYIDAFSGEEEFPSIIITGKNSKRGNPYISFDVIG